MLEHKLYNEKQSFRQSNLFSKAIYSLIKDRLLFCTKIIYNLFMRKIFINHMTQNRAEYLLDITYIKDEIR